GSVEGFDLAGVAANTDTIVTFANGGVQGRVNVADGRWQADVSQYQVPLSPFLPAGTLPGDAQAVGSGTFAGSVEGFDLASVRANANTIVTFAEDKGARGTVNLADGSWSAKVEEFLIPLAPFVPPGTLPGDAIASGNGTFAGNLNSFDAASLQADANVGVVFKGGGAEGSVSLADNRWSASFDRLQVPLASYLPPDLPLSVGTLVKLGKKPLTIASAVNGFAPENLTAEGMVGFQVEGGEAIIDGSFDRGNWKAQVEAQQLPVASLFPRASLEALTQKQVTLDLQGELAGNATLAGTLTDFTPEAIAAALNPATVREGGLQLTNLQLNDLAFDTVLAGPLQQTPEGLVVAVAGQDGSIVGEQDRLSVLLESPDKTGQPWSYFPLAFQGDFDWKGEQRADCAVDEGSDAPKRECQRRSIALTEQTYPVQISGRRKGDRLTLTLNNLPLSPFDLQPPESSGLRPPITGAISTDITWNLATGTGSGSLQLDRPTIGLLAANSFQSQFQYTGNSLVLRETALSKGESEYLLSGRVDNLNKDPQFDGEVKISQGQVQDVLTALQWFDIDDFARGLQPAQYSDPAQFDLYSVGIPEASLFAQLRRFSEIEALLAQQRDRDDDQNPLPRLTELQGNFNGTIAAKGSVATGADVNFDLTGDAWQWGEYRVNQIRALGSFVDGILALQPLDVKANLGQETETLLSFAGQLGGDRQSAQFSLTNFPSTVLEKFVPFPGGVSVSGNLNASATLAGSAANPQARGELTLVGGLLNGEAIDSGRGSFLYSDSRLNFSSDILVEGTEPIKITGSLPYQFPGSTVTPANEVYNVTARVQNEGLAVLNFLTDAVAWKGGQGQANVTVAGERIPSGSEENPSFRYDPRSTQGEIVLTNAEFASPNLPENLTSVNAQARLDGDLLIVENFQGKFRKGEVTAQGNYSLFGFSLSPDDPQALTVKMADLELDVKGRYRGGIDGTIGIGGSFLNPAIGGEIRLSNGQILLPDQTATPIVTPTNETENPFQAFYENLNLILGEKIQILKPPVLNFIADGKLTVNGTIEDPSADGTIVLRQGLVNIFTTEFTLARNANNTATFTSEQGLDPDLSVLMRAAVPEASHSPLSRDATATSSEIEELAIERGTVETVRIEAQVDGPASQLANNLQLSSSPGRSEREIIALMGGGFINTLGTGDSTLALANLAGSVLLTQFQTALNQALGLRDFRIFPTTTSRTSSLTLGAELGIKLTENVSASVLRILDANQPTRFGVRYRIDDNILLRGSSDFEEDTRGEIEIRFRF
ncbi:MAG: translocation/assembly module TamB domain-containing protein, partial [Geitlerinemataceae cyanobacterium]